MDGSNENRSSDEQRQNRRQYQRLKVRVPLELQLEDNPTPIRGATSDLSLGGCYIETVFPFPVGTTLDIKLQLENTLVIEGTVVTSDPQVGNGIRFTKMLTEDQEALRAHLESAEQAHKAESGEAGAD